MKNIARRLKGFEKTNVWQEFSQMAIKYNAVNLGQGFPDWESPPFVKDFAIKAIQEDFNQYCRPPGLDLLCKNITDFYSDLYKRPLDYLTEVTISVGATEGLFGIMQSLLNDGDEVIMLEPAFDIYPPQVQMAGGNGVYLTLVPPKTKGDRWGLDLDELEKLITPKTKILLLNTPHNPTGRVIDEHEMGRIAEIMKKNPHVVAVMDEVYEHMVFGQHKHVRLASLPGMFDRTLTVCSAGKTFSVTGWKIGWVIGPAPLVRSVFLANQWVQFSVSTPSQKAVADCLQYAQTPYEGYPSYFAAINSLYAAKVGRLERIVERVGMVPFAPEGSYYLLCDISGIRVPAEYFLPTEADKNEGVEVVTADYAFSRWLCQDIGVCVIPASAFYEQEKKHLATHLVRLCSCKKNETLDLAEERLERLLTYWDGK